MTTDLEQLRAQPYELLVELDRQLEKRSEERGLGGARNEWTGLGFRLRDDWYLAPRADVREVLTPPEYTRVPGAKSWLLGIANVRGDLLPIIDLGHLLGAEEVSPAGEKQRVIVLNDDEVPAGFLVDDIAGFRGFTPAEQRHDVIDQVPGHDPEHSPYLGAFVRADVAWRVFSLRRLAAGTDFRDAGA